MSDELRVRAEVRREPARALDVGSDEELVARIAAEIERDGPITFARFMNRALYEPNLGYYRRARPGPGRAGDFLTAPETHPLFGRAIARQLDEVWRRLKRPDPFVVREHGAGEGALALAILDGLAVERSELLDAVVVEPVEIEPRRLEAFAATLARSGHAHRHRQPGDAPIVGAVLANEVLDALPVHRVEWRDGRLREALVTWQGDRFATTLGHPTTPALDRRLRDEEIRLREGQRAEISLAVDAWVRDVAGSIRRGLLLVIDYGYPATELYGPRFLAGTLAAYVNHRVHDDPFANVGRQDLTAHVDLTAVERAAVAEGLEPLGATTQAEFLVGLGIEDLLRSAQEDPATTLSDYAALRSGLARLVDPAVTGRFRVLAFGRGLGSVPPLRGFAFRLRHPRPPPAVAG